MIEVQLTELDLSLEVAEIGDLGAILDEHSTVGLQGPLTFGVDVEPINYGYLDLDLVGFPYLISAYDIAVKNGFVGSELQWLASLKGADGDLSPAGEAAVVRAEAAATSASGDALAAAGFRTEAYTYSGVAGVHAQSAAEMFTNATAIRDETGQIAAAMTSIYQSSEAMLIGTQEIATATIQERVKAETARALAEQIETRVSHAETNARESAASASDQATIAVEAQNVATDKAAAAVLSESNASSYANDAQVEAAAANQSKIIATAARDQAQITAQGVVVEVSRASAFADAAGAHSEAARLQKVAAEAANTQAGTRAAAALTSQQTATAQATLAGEKAVASEASRVAANTKAGEAAVSAQQSAQSSSDANGQRVAAEAARNVSVTARDQSQGYATASAGYRDQAFIYADTAGNIYGALATRTGNVELRIGNAEGRITTTEGVALDAQGKVNLTVGVTLNGNGYVSGTRLSNNGSTANFTIIGDSFYLVNPNNGSPFRPFVVDGNQVTFNSNVRINGNLFIDGTVNTPSLANNSITVIDSVTQTANFVGQGAGGSYYDEESGQWIYYGGKQVIISYIINLAYPAKLVCISSFTHVYTASGTPGFNYDISVNGGGIIATGGSGVRVVGSCISGYINLPAGQHEVTTNWQGDSNVFALNYANLVIMAVYK